MEEVIVVAVVEEVKDMEVVIVVVVMLERVIVVSMIEEGKVGLDKVIFNGNSKGHDGERRGCGGGGRGGCGVDIWSDVVAAVNQREAGMSGQLGRTCRPRRRWTVKNSWWCLRLSPWIIMLLAALNSECSSMTFGCNREMKRSLDSHAKVTASFLCHLLMRVCGLHHVYCLVSTPKQRASSWLLAVGWDQKLFSYNGTQWPACLYWWYRSALLPWQ